MELVEYDSLGEDYASRGPRQEEQVDLLRRLWKDPLLDYTGKWHRIERAGLLPLPGRQIPIWFGGFNPVAFRRAARLGDGFIFGGAHADGLSGLDQIRAALEAENRDPSSFGIEAMMNWQAGPDKWAQEVEDWVAAGADYVSMRAMGAGFDSPQAHIDALVTYWDVVGGLAG